MKVLRWPALATLMLAACQGGSQVSLSLPTGADNRPALVREVVSAAGDRAPTPDACIAVLATDDAVSGVPLYAPQSVWRRPLKADSRPQLLGDLVVFAQGETLHALRAQDGEAVLTADLPQARLVGATVYGERLLVVTRAGDGATGQLTAFDLATGDAVDSRPLPADSGRPRVAGDLLLLPLHHQSVAVLDPETLHERGRLRATDGLLNSVQLSANHVLVGDEQVHVLTPQFDGRTASLPQITVPQLELPGTRQPFTSDYACVPGGDSAFGRVGLSVHMTPADEGPALEGAYAVFYRHVYALNPAGELLWARGLPADVVRAQATANGLLVALSDGRLTLLSATTVTQVAPPGGTTRSAALPSAACPLDDAATARADDLETALLAMLRDRDARLLPSQLFALAALQAMPGDAVTRGILLVASDTRRSTTLRTAARRALMARTEATALLLAAAARGYDFLSATPAPAMDVLAPALAAHHAQQAVPVLRARLFDHATPSVELLPIAEALATLDKQTAQKALHTLLYRHRADSSFAATPEVYAALAASYGGLAGAPGLTELHALSEAETTHPVLRLALQQRLPPAVEQAAPTVATPTAPSPAPPSAPARPSTFLLSAAQVRRTFEHHAEDIPGCLSTAKAAEEVKQVRVALVVDAAGQPLERYYLPDEERFIACMEPLLSEYAFPESGAPRQVIVYTWNAPSAPPGATPEPATPPFWQAYIPSKAPMPQAHGTPFWQDQNPLYVSVDLGYARSVDEAPRDGTKAEETAPAPNKGAPARTTPLRPEPAAPPAPEPQTPPQGPSPSKPNGGAPAKPAPDDVAPWWAPTEG